MSELGLLGKEKGTEHDENDECFQAREVGLTLCQDVESLSARLTGSAQSSVESAQRLAKEVGVLSDVRTLPMMQCGLEWPSCWFTYDLCDRLWTTWPSRSGSAAICSGACESCREPVTPA